MATRRQTLRLVDETAMLGPAAGLDADTYDWRDVHSGIENGRPRVSTLEFLREAAARDAEVLIHVNLRGFGGKNEGGTWLCDDPNDSAAGVVQLAADWVRYTNVVLPTVQRKQPLGVEAVRDIAGMKLPAKSLPTRNDLPLGPVLWWQIGAAPTVDAVDATIRGHALPPPDYARRYTAIARAMKAVDASIRVGPQVADANSPHLAALLAEPNAPLDYVGYRPMNTALRAAILSGEVDRVSAALGEIHAWHAEQAAALRSKLKAAGRDPNTPLVASAWNDLGPRGEQTTAARTMAHALATAETMLTFADLGLAAAFYYESPSLGKPGFEVLEMLNEQMGTRLCAAAADAPDIRLYVTRQDDPAMVSVWALNFSAADEHDVSVQLDNLPTVELAQVRMYGATSGPYALLAHEHQHQLAWHFRTLDDTDPRTLKLRLPPATITLVTLRLAPSNPVEAPQ